MRKSRYTYVKPFLGLLIFLFSSSLFSQVWSDFDLKFGNACANSLNGGFNTYNFSVSFVSTGFPAGNTFVVQLSDENGDFTNSIDGPPILDDDINVFFDPIESSFSLPTDAAGQGYRIRIQSSTQDASGELITSPPSEPFSAYYRPTAFLVLNEGDNVALCEGEATEISLNTVDDPVLSGDSYTWYKDGQIYVFEGGPTLTITETGRYFARFDLGACTDGGLASNEITVSPSVDAGSFIIEAESNVIALCSDETSVFTASIEDPDYTYTWYKDDEELASGEGLTTFETPDTGQYGVYTLEIDTGANCSTFSQNDVLVEPKELANFVATLDGELTRVLLPGETFTFTASTEPALSDLSYRWFLNDVLLEGASNGQLNVVEAGEYFVEVTDESSDCKVASNSEVYSVFAAEALAVEIRTDLLYELCNSSMVTLVDVGVMAVTSTGVSVNLSSDQLSDLRYQWFKDGVAITDEILNDLDLDSYLDNGTYHVNASIGIGDLVFLEGDSNEINISLIPGTEIISSSNSNTLCPGSAINLSINALSGYTYTWFKDDEVLEVDDFSSVDVNEVGVYYVLYEGFDCSVETERVEVIEFDDEALQVSPSTKAILFEGETVTLTATGADSYEWLSDTRVLLSTNETLEVDIIGIYTLIGTVGDCQVEKEIEVEEDDESPTIPNIISPFNGDGKNDTWEIPNRFSFQSNVQVLIYDSRGNEVLNTTDYQNNWPEDNNIRSGMLFYFKVIQENNLIKAGTISVLE